MINMKIFAKHHSNGKYQKSSFVSFPMRLNNQNWNPQEHKVPVWVEGKAGDRANALGHEGGIVANDAELFSLKRKHLYQLLGRATNYHRSMSVHCQSCQRSSVCIYRQVRLARLSYVEELYVSCLGSAHYLLFTIHFHKNYNTDRLLRKLANLVEILNYFGFFIFGSV